MLHWKRDDPPHNLWRHPIDDFGRNLLGPIFIDVDQNRIHGETGVFRNLRAGDLLGVPFPVDVLHDNLGRGEEVSCTRWGRWEPVSVAANCDHRRIYDGRVAPCKC
jgi:hypothetical protein